MNLRWPLSAEEPTQTEDISWYGRRMIQTGRTIPGGKLNPPIDGVGGRFVAPGATDLFYCTGFKFWFCAI